MKEKYIVDGKYEFDKRDKKIKLKGELGTGHILDIVLIIFVLSLIVIVFNVTGVSFTDVLSLAGSILKTIWDWFWETLSLTLGDFI